MELSLLSWNLAGRDLLDQVAAEPVDVALLQEVPRPASTPPFELYPDSVDQPWLTVGWKTRRWRTAIARNSERVELRPIPTGPLDGPDRSLLAVSRPGTLTAAEVIVDGRSVLTVVSWYATWEHPPGSDHLLGADGSAHRLLSDVAALIDQQRGPRLLIAGDLNLLYGYGERGSRYWADRYATVFDRAAAMGLQMVGPQHPNGREADPWPAELPEDSRNVPTFHTRQQGASGATRQLDFVFASDRIASQTSVRARNVIDEWGPSDHCRIDIHINIPDGWLFSAHGA